MKERRQQPKALRWGPWKHSVLKAQQVTMIRWQGGGHVASAGKEGV